MWEVAGDYYNVDFRLELEVNGTPELVRGEGIEDMVGNGLGGYDAGPIAS